MHVGQEDPVPLDDVDERLLERGDMLGIVCDLGSSVSVQRTRVNEVSKERIDSHVRLRDGLAGHDCKNNAHHLLLEPAATTHELSILERLSHRLGKVKDTRNVARRPPQLSEEHFNHIVFDDLILIAHECFVELVQPVVGQLRLKLVHPLLIYRRVRRNGFPPIRLWHALCQISESSFPRVHQYPQLDTIVMERPAADPRDNILYSSQRPIPTTVARKEGEVAEGRNNVWRCSES
mmetsp:Transcript_33136/g.74360  ORF Transcript_33136/g.74360 Transcript_33136/m.74360 type:complete len:235 (-) Transcript_33136:254-958(-)